MALYEIDIHRQQWNTPVDMQAVYASLRQAGIGFDPDERRGNIHGIDTSDEQPEYVYVDTGYVGASVHVINGLGYETDEDGGEE